MEARVERPLSRFHQRCQKVALLIGDELGFVPFDRTGGQAQKVPGTSPALGEERAHI